MRGASRLLSVIPGPAFGGAHNQALRLRPLLDQRGIETVVALPEEAEAAAARLSDGGVETVLLPLRRLRADPNPVAQARFLATVRTDVRRLRRLVEDSGATVVQVHGVTNGQGALAARLQGVGVVWQLLDTRAPMPLRRAAMPMVRHLADVITTWGEELARVHPGATALGSRLIPVYPPVDAREFAPDPRARTEARRRLGLREEDKLVAAVGVLNPQKGHEHLVAAADLVRRSRPEARFAIFGARSPAHADYERELRREVAARGLADRFEFVDPGTDVPLLMQAVDVFAMSSVPRSEGMPTVILEAMHCRKAIVSSRVGSIDELVEDGSSALLVPPGQVRSLADSISRLLASDDERERLAAGARRRARDHFDLEHLADLHAGAYRLAAGRRTSTAS